MNLLWRSPAYKIVRSACCSPRDIVGLTSVDVFGAFDVNSWRCFSYSNVNFKVS